MHIWLDFLITVADSEPQPGHGCCTSYHGVCLEMTNQLVPSDGSS
jgi:hypothetical protein